MVDGPAVPVFAHRGASEEEPEHTLSAYLLAVEHGADGVECDVRLTRDGVLVCVHDRRIDRTSSGSGVVSAHHYHQLAVHDYSEVDGAPADGWGAPHPARTSLLTLRTLLETMLDASDTVRFAIETKHPLRYGRDLERALFTLLREMKLLDSDGHAPRVQLMSFSVHAVRWMAKAAPQTPVVFLMDPVRWPYKQGSLPRGVDISGPSIETLRKHPHYVERVHARGGKVHVWVVDEPADIDLCVKLGVDAIITNRPAQVLARLGR